MRYFLSLLLLLISSASPCMGQTPAPAVGRTCRILFLSAPENAPKTIYLNDGTNTQKVDLPTLNFSGVYKLATGNITLKLCTSIPTEQQPIPAGAPSAAMPESISDCYLLVASDPKNPVAPLQCQVINASPGGFRKGQMMWLNLTPYQVGGQLGSKTLNLKPNSQSIVDPPAEGQGSYPVKIGYAPGKDKSAILIVSTEWPHDPNGRNIVFVMMVPNTKIPRIKGYSDVRAAAAPPTATQ